jgi:hypothetical protein
MFLIDLGWTDRLRHPELTKGIRNISSVAHGNPEVAACGAP